MNFYEVHFLIAHNLIWPWSVFIVIIRLLKDWWIEHDGTYYSNGKYNHKECSNQMHNRIKLSQVLEKKKKMDPLSPINLTSHPYIGWGIYLNNEPPKNELKSSSTD